MGSSERVRCGRGHDRRAVGMLAGLAGALMVAAIAAGPVRAAEPVTFLVLSPNEEIGEMPADALYAISILDPGHTVDPASIKFFLDGLDRTTDAQVTPELVTFLSNPPLAPGKHRFEIQLKAVGGADIPGFRQEYMTAGEPIHLEAERAWENKGRLTMEFLGDKVSGAGDTLRINPDQTSTGRLDMSGRVSGWKYDGALFLTSDEKKGFQPRDRFSLHVDHNWIGVDVGDLNYRFSEFVLQGKRARGAGGYLRLGDTELRFMRGAIDRAIPGTVITQPDTVHGGVDTLSIAGATYRRNLVGARLEMGQGKTYQSGVDLIRVRDDVGSVPVGLLPKDNLVLGSNLIYAPFHRHVIFEGDAALSFLTNDISGGAMSREQIDSLVTGANLPSWVDPKKWENIFILNLSTTPLDPRKLSNLAWKGGVKGNALGNVFEARYQSVGPTYTSLAAPSIQNDRKGLRLTDDVRVLNRKLELNGEFENYSDNLKNDKQYTTDSDIYGVNATFLPGRVDIKNVSVGFRQYRRTNNAPSADTLGRVDETTNTFRVGTGYHFYYLQGHELSVNYQHSKTDAAQSAGDADQTDWHLDYSTKFESMPLGAELQFGFNKTQYPGAVSPSPSEVKYTTWGVGGTYDLDGGKVESFTSLVRVSGTADVAKFGGDKTTWNAGARYRLTDATSLSGRLGFAKFSDKSGAGKDYHETLLDIRMVQEF